MSSVQLNDATSIKSELTSHNPNGGTESSEVLIKYKYINVGCDKIIQLLY